MHPAPLSFVAALIIPFSFSRALMHRMSKVLAYFMYWLENIFFTLVFTFMELLLSPIVYAKILYNMLLIIRTTGNGTMGFFKSGMYCIVWTFLGPIITLYIVTQDIGNFVKILTNTNGFINTMEDNMLIVKVNDNVKLQLCNEIRAIAISLFNKVAV